MAIQAPPDEKAVEGLRSRFSGEVVGPADAVYAEHRKVWNGSIDRRPALIARCADPADVAAAIGFGREHGLPIAVRGGGHSFPGLSVCDDGLVIDLSLMKAIGVDPDAGTATVGAGTLLGELDGATQEHGLAVPSGIVTHTGVAGLTLGGGIGWIQRRHGLSVDKLESVEVVTADGELVTAREEENDDLFWGVRGGGGNFGVVTSFRFRTVPLGPTVLAGPIFWPIEKSPQVLRFYRDWIADAPDDLMTIIIHRKAPPLPFVPSELHGKLVVVVASCWAGDLEEGERFLAPLKAFESPVLDVCQRKPFLEHQRMFDPSFPHGWWYYMRSCDVAELTDDVIDIAVEHSMRIRSPLTSFPIWQMGGAVAKVADDATPFNGRSAGHTFNITSAVADGEGFDEERQWVRDFWDALAPYHQGVYVNFLMDEGEDRIREAYGPAKYDRLKALKRKYDPENVFSLNQNIPPG
jgi:FAD/FMN-containing dehydrogenase